jgi:hypothetical protein
MSKDGMKWDTGKTRWSLLPFTAIREVAKVLTWAVERDDPAPYEPGSWKQVDHHRYVSALYRHLDAYLDPGQDDYDDESDLHHLAHAGACVLFLLWQALTDPSADRTGETY